jgi:hypothetical protein
MHHGSRLPLCLQSTVDFVLNDTAGTCGSIINRFQHKVFQKRLSGEPDIIAWCMSYMFEYGSGQGMTFLETDFYIMGSMI